MAKPKSKKIGSARKGARARSTKPDQVEVKVGVSKTLLSNLPDDEAALRQYELLNDLKAKSKRAADKVSKQKKSMKESGYDVEAFERTASYERYTPEELGAHLSELVRLARLRGLPIQMKLFETQYGNVQAQASAEGRADGKNGRNANTSRWPEDQEGGKEYMASWMEGQEELVAGGATASEQNEEEEED